MDDRAKFVQEMHTVENLRGARKSDALVGYWRCDSCDREQVTKTWFKNPDTGLFEYVKPTGWTREDGVTLCDVCQRHQFCYWH